MVFSTVVLNVIDSSQRTSVINGTQQNITLKFEHKKEKRKGVFWKWQKQNTVDIS